MVGVFRIIVVIFLISLVACDSSQTGKTEERTLKVGDIESSRKTSKAPKPRISKPNPGGFCESLTTNICNSVEVDDYRRIKSIFERLEEYIYQSHTKNLLEEVLGSPIDREDVKYWDCADLIFEQPKGIEDEIYEKYQKCEEIRLSAIQETLFPQQIQEKVRSLFLRTRDHIIESLRQMIALERNRNHPEKVEKLSKALNDIFKTHITFSQDKPRWNMSAHTSNTILRVEGMALLAAVDPSYLTGTMYHEFGHIINPSRSLSDDYINKENIPFYTSMSCLKNNGFARSADLNCYQNRLLVCDQEQKAYCQDMKDFVDSFPDFPMMSYKGPTHIAMFPLFEPCQNDQTEEAFSDLVMAEMLAKKMAPFSVEENRSKIKKYMAHLCYEFQNFSDISADKQAQFNLGTYPNETLRLDLILNHPGIRNAIGCEPIQADEKPFCKIAWD